jgi:hypothetical protein
MRKLKDGVLFDFIKYCSNTEVPSFFALWCGIATISAALGRDAFIDMGHYTIFPNLYVVLVAGSAKCRKSTAISIAGQLLQKIRPEINMFSQKLTPEALIGALSTVKEESDTVLRGSAEGIIVADELSTLVDKNAFNSGMISFLTTLWDSKDSFTYETKSRGKETVYNSCVSILGGSTLEWIKEVIPVTAIGGGFTSRVVFVYRDDYERLILWTKKNEQDRILGDNLLHDLNDIAKLRGEFVVDEKAEAFCDKDYREFMDSHPFLKNRFLMGYAGRRYTILLKIAIIVSAAMSSSRVISLADINVAKKILENAEKQMPLVLRTIATDDSGVLNEEVLKIIYKFKKISRKQLLTLVHHKMQASDLDKIIDTLCQAALVKEVHEERIIYYQATKIEGGKDMSFTDAILQLSQEEIPK